MARRGLTAGDDVALEDLQGMHVAALGCSSNIARMPGQVRWNEARAS